MQITVPVNRSVMLVIESELTPRLYISDTMRRNPKGRTSACRMLWPASSPRPPSRKNGLRRRLGVSRIARDDVISLERASTRAGDPAGSGRLRSLGSGGSLAGNEAPDDCPGSSNAVGVEPERT